MLPIPSSLLDKVKQAMQTIGNNAEPKMTIIAQKASKFIYHRVVFLIQEQCVQATH